MIGSFRKFASVLPLLYVHPSPSLLSPQPLSKDPRLIAAREKRLARTAGRMVEEAVPGVGAPVYAVIGILTRYKNGYIVVRT